MSHGREGDSPRASADAPLLEVSEIVISFGGVTALDGPSLSIEQGQICGLIGPNGAGKTTLFNCVSRIYQPERGRITFDGTDLLTVPRSGIATLGIARTFQNVGLIASLTVRENVAVGAHTRTRAGFLTASLWLPRVLREERMLRHEVDTQLERLGLTDVAAERPNALPFGTRKRVELSRALMARPRLLLLDEPACGLNHTEVSELAGLIVGLRDDYEVTVLLVEHHMAMVMAISEQVVVLSHGRTIAAGTPAEVRANPHVIEAYLGTAA